MSKNKKDKKSGSQGSKNSVDKPQGKKSATKPAKKLRKT